MLQDKRDQAASIVPPVSNEAFTSWYSVTRSLLGRVMGPTHHITEDFEKLDFLASFYGDPGSAFNADRNRARGLLEAAMIELRELADDGPQTDEAGTDPELWEHVAPEIQAEAWGKAASQAVIFTEDRIRKWAGRPAAEGAKDLAVAVFGSSGDYRMGLTHGEKQGWQLFAQGLAQAVRNADAHRIQTRDDHKRYAMGVVGACSLLLTQMRHEHGNRFHDQAPLPIGISGGYDGGSLDEP